MTITGKFTTMAQAALLMAILAITAFAAQQGRTRGVRDGLAGLKRAITAANAPSLSSTQETQITALITAFRDAQPDEEDATLSAAKDAFDAAILAGNQTAANTAAMQIAARQAQLSLARLQSLSQFQIAVLANLNAGGQLSLLTETLGAEKLLHLVGSLAGHGGGR